MSGLLEAHGLRVEFFPQGRRVVAVDGVDLSVAPGECLALVGESGSGKTTLARTLMGLLEPAAGSVSFEGRDLAGLPAAELRRLRRRFQMVFQSSSEAFDPRLRVGQQLAEPLIVHRLVPAAERPERIRRLLELVGLVEAQASRYPHQLSGGQRQRLAIARALATEPELLVLDEPVSALDVSVRARILGLLIELQRDLELAMLFITHDLSVVGQLAHRLAVMLEGKIVEAGPVEQVLLRPQHPYTQKLIAAVPDPDPKNRPRPNG